MKGWKSGKRGLRYMGDYPIEARQHNGTAGRTMCELKWIEVWDGIRIRTQPNALMSKD